MPGRPRLTVEPPSWFDLRRYAAAAEMDAADWYLNLSLRSEVGRRKDNKGLLTYIVRKRTPLLRRSNIEGDVYAALLGADMLPEWMALLHGKARAGVGHMTAQELYFLESGLPAEVRQFGAAYRAGQTQFTNAPPGFTAPIDEQLNPRYLTAHFSVDVFRPLEEVIEDVRAKLIAWRGELTRAVGEKPYAKALRKRGRHYHFKLSTLATVGLLPLIDLTQWYEETGDGMPRPAAVSSLLHCSYEKLRQARTYLPRVLDEFSLRAWLLSAAEEAVRNAS
jgi:hypothetical protein